LDRLQRPCREWAALEPLRIAVPVLVHIGTKRSKRAPRHSAMPTLPSSQIIEREGVVRILGKQRCRVEDHKPQDHLTKRDFVHGDAILGEMRRRVDMGAVLTDHLVVGAAESVLADRIRLPCLWIDSRRHLRLTKTRPNRRIWPETVGQVDELLAGDNPIRTIEIALRARGRTETDQRDNDEDMPAPDEMSHSSLRKQRQPSASTEGATARLYHLGLSRPRSRACRRQGAAVIAPQCSPSPTSAMASAAAGCCRTPPSRFPPAHVSGSSDAMDRAKPRSFASSPARLRPSRARSSLPGMAAWAGSPRKRLPDRTACSTWCSPQTRSGRGCLPKRKARTKAPASLEWRPASPTSAPMRAPPARQ